MNDYSFGNFLYSLRTEKGLSQSQLGQMLGVTNKAVSKWENGSTKPNTKLIPQIAVILDVTVEELFACKRIATNSEMEHIKQYLVERKKRYAILSSVFLSLLVLIPILLIEFICVVMGFDLPGDVLGPLGAVTFILFFIVSLTAYIIYRNDYNKTIVAKDNACSDRFAEAIKRGYAVSIIAWLCVLGLLLPAYFLITWLSSGNIVANAFLALAVLVLAVLLALIICFTGIKRLLGIKNAEKRKRVRLRFREMPAWCKICYAAVSVIFPISMGIQQWGAEWVVVKLVSFAAWFGCALAVIIYSMRKS